LYQSLLNVCLEVVVEEEVDLVHGGEVLLVEVQAVGLVGHDQVVVAAWHLLVQEVVDHRSVHHLEGQLEVEMPLVEQMLVPSRRVDPFVLAEVQLPCVGQMQQVVAVPRKLEVELLVAVGRHFVDLPAG